MHFLRFFEVGSRNSPDLHLARSLVDGRRVEVGLEYVRLLHRCLVVLLQFPSDAVDSSPQWIGQVGVDAADEVVDVADAGIRGRLKVVPKVIQKIHLGDLCRDVATQKLFVSK